MYNNKINLTVLLDKNLYSFLYIRKKINEISINKMFTKEIAGPNTIEAGIIENSIKKKLFIVLLSINKFITNNSFRFMHCILI